MQKDIIIKKSKIHGKGVFAGRDFKKGEIVLAWKPKPVRKSEVDKFPIKKKNRTMHIKRKYYLMQSPERYVNHSCEANTKIKDMADVAIRDIKKGEEITSQYKKSLGGGFDFNCKCKSKKCKGNKIYG